MKRVVMVLMRVTLLAAGCAAQPSVAAWPRIETGVDSEAWARIPAGAFLMGPHNQEMLIDHDYQITVTPVTNAQYARYLNAAQAAGKVKTVNDKVVGPYPGDPFHNVKHEKEIKAGDWPHLSISAPELRLTFDGKTFGVRPGYENHPMVMVTWFGAKAYCEFNGGRLPDEAEWEKAARGTDGRAFPWGADIARNNANFYASRDPFEKLLPGSGDTTPVGFYSGKTYDDYQTLNSASPYGAHDMAGNVWQWTGDIYEGVHYRYMRGGSKDNYEYNLRAFTRNSAEPDYASPGVGFRCVK